MTKRTPKSEALTSLILETFRLNGALLDAGNKITKPFGLTSARWQVLGSVGLDEQHSKTVAQIARRMGLARQGVQRIVNDLENLGLLTYEDNIDHKRAKLVQLTSAGEAALTGIGEVQSAWVNGLSDGMKKTEINRALCVIRSVIERLENTNGETST